MNLSWIHRFGKDCHAATKQKLGGSLGTLVEIIITHYPENVFAHSTDQTVELQLENVPSRIIFAY